MNNDYNQYANPYNNNPYPNCDNKQKDDCYPQCIDLRDHGPQPYVVNIQEATNQNYNFRLALWTGTYFQLTLMNINAQEDIGLEMHPDVDQFLRIEEGQGLVLMGDSQDRLYYQQRVYPGYVIFVPAGKWHNLFNVGCTPLKLYSIYAPPEHPRGTVHRTKEDAEHHHHHHHHDY